MKQLYQLTLDGKITQIISNDEDVSFLVGDNKLEILTYHEQDCCEHVYGDFSNFKFHAEEIIKANPKVMTIYGDETGLGLVVDFDNNVLTRVLVPCYDHQNGYYSSNLSLELSYKGVNTTINVNEFVDSSE